MPITKADGKKGGKQKYRVRVNYTDESGNYKQTEKTAYGLEEAKALEAVLMQKASAQKETARKMTVQELHEEYIRTKRHEARETTVDKSETIYRLHIKELLGAVALDKLKTPVLQEWKQKIYEKEISPRMRKNIYSELRAMLNFAVKMEYIPANPLYKVGNFSDRLEAKKEMLFYTPEEFLKFIKPARELAENGSVQDYGFYIFFMLAYYTGARKGEINALRWCDIVRNEMRITRSVALKLKGEDRFTPPKNKSSIRNIQLPEPLIQALNTYKARCEKLEGFSEECLVCGFNRPLRDTTIQSRFSLYSKQAGTKKIRIHDFRHSHASLLANSGINIQEIARRLGHSDIEMTLNTYSHLYPKEQERALDVLNAVKSTL